MKNLLIAVLLMLFSHKVFSQDSYINKKPIGNSSTANKVDKKEYPYGPLPYRFLSEAIGEKFVLIPTDWHYLYIQAGDIYDPRGIYTLGKENVGKIFVLTAVDDNYAHLKDDKGNSVVTKLVDGAMPDMASVTDIDEARKLLLNKTVWANTNTLSVDSGRLKEIYDIRFEAVTVTDIYASDDYFKPLRMVLKTKKGDIGYKDIVISGLNHPILHNDNCFNDTFFTKDPKLTYKFSPAMWKHIENQEAVMGMTEKQLELTLGKPDEINKTNAGGAVSSQWVYKNSPYAHSFFYFFNGRLNAWN